MKAFVFVFVNIHLWAGSSYLEKKQLKITESDALPLMEVALVCCFE